MKNTIMETLMESKSRQHLASLFEDILNEAEKYGDLYDDMEEGVYITEWQNWTITEDKEEITFMDGTNNGYAIIAFNKIKTEYNRFEYSYMCNVLPTWMEIRI